MGASMAERLLAPDTASMSDTRQEAMDPFVNGATVCGDDDDAPSARSGAASSPVGGGGAPRAPRSEAAPPLLPQWIEGGFGMNA